MSSSTIELANVGPVEKVSIPVPEEGGIVVLRGRNGKGKSRALDAVEAAITGRGKVEVRDGQSRAEVEGLGVRLVVGRSTRRTGELEVETLDGRLSVAELVDPGLKNPEAADSRRIKALAQVSGILPSAGLFYRILEGIDAAGLNLFDGDEQDLVAMADRVKRRLEAAARSAEEKATLARARGDAANARAATIDTEAPADADRLQADLFAAMEHQQKLTAEATAALAAKNSTEAARVSLEAAESRYEGPTLEQAIIAADEARGDYDRAKEEVRRLEAALAEAEKAEADKRQALSAAVTARHTAENHFRLLGSLRQQLCPPPAGPSDDDLAAASSRVADARKAIETGALIRKAREDKAAADEFRAEAAKHAETGAKLRAAAAGTDSVLSEAVSKGSRLRVRDGRLMLDTPRGETYFADLSAGERWKLALDVAIDAVGQRGVFTIPQEAWEGLDPINRRELAEHVAGRGVVILTAEASADEALTASVFS